MANIGNPEDVLKLDSNIAIPELNENQVLSRLLLQGIIQLIPRECLGISIQADSPFPSSPTLS